MKFVGITKRWFLNVALIVFVILLTVSVTMIVSFRNYYYSVADMALDAYTAKEISTAFNYYGETKPENFELAGRHYIENFPDRETVAVWVIDNTGKIVLSTSGFDIKGNVEMPDYEAALKGNGSSIWTGKLPSGEKIKAKTCIYTSSDGTYTGAVRFMISLEQLDAQLTKISITIAVAALVLVALFLVSGTFFIRSIVNPVKDIGETAKKIARGDFAARIDHYPYNDEIGELCTTINDMATKLGENDRLKNDFISTVSHELRTPLTAIKGWGETLIQIGSTDETMTNRGMNVIISEAGRLNEMVEELLDFSRMSSGGMKLTNEKTDILAELDEVVFAFRERTVKEGVEIIYNVPSTPAPATADASRIKQVFINILDNALKYSEHGGKIIIIAEITNPATIVITISDTGAGIRPEDLPHVKEKFYKANSTVRGSGIGLAVVDEIIKLHKGTLDIDSVYGEGTTVKVTLPIELAERNDKSSLQEGDKPENEQKEK